MECLLNINDNKTCICEVDFLFQKDPFPGDNTYELIIDNADLKHDFDELEIGRYENINPLKVQQIFWSINFLRAKNDTWKSIEIKYFINSIDVLTVENNRIIMKGICSSIIK